jgi:hypothetical protein
LHEQLRGNLVADLVRRGQPEPPESESIRQIVTSRPWLFEDEAYHIDVSHLAAVVRHSLISKRRESLEKALDLCAYGSRLSSRLQYEGDPPFQRTYDDHAVYLRALLGEGVEKSLEHFRAKLKSAEGDEERRLLSAVALVRLYTRLDRLPEAIEIHARNLQGSFAGVPSLESLCERAGRPDLLVEHSRRLDDPVRYAAAVLAARGSAGASK